MSVEEFVSTNLLCTTSQFCYIYTPSEIIHQDFLGIMRAIFLQASLCNIIIDGYFLPKYYLTRNYISFCEKHFFIKLEYNEVTAVDCSRI